MLPLRSVPSCVLILVALTLGAPPAQAQEPTPSEETWLLTLEPGFTTAVAEPQVDQYGPGGTLAIGAYRSLAPWVLVGARLRGSVFADGDPPANPLYEDQPAGGLFTLSAALRLRVASADDPRRGTGPWIEVAGGPGLTDGLVRGVVEAGIGWAFEAGAVDIGPALRYQHVFHDAVADNGPLQPGDANLLIVGVELVLLDERPTPTPTPTSTPEPEPEAGPCDHLREDIDGFEDDDGCPDPDNDQDGILDVDDACPNEPETFNGINDHDGCPDSGEIEVVDDRLVIEESVFFAFDESDLKPSGAAVTRQIVALWDRHPEWVGIVVEGHADSRGTREYNQDLSERRADSVKAALMAEQMAEARIDTEAHGEMQPRVHDADSEREHALNRRVEFVVVRAEEGPRIDERPDPEVMEETLEENQ